MRGRKWRNEWTGNGQLQEILGQSGNWLPVNDLAVSCKNFTNYHQTGSVMVFCYTQAQTLISDTK